MATPRFAWGIDVGNRALKAVKLVRGANGLRVDDFAVIEHEHILSNAGDNKESLVQAALSNFVQRHNARGAAIAVGVSGQSSFARFIKLPPVEPKKIPEIVRFEAIQQIPFPLDDVEWSYQLFQNENSPDVEVGIFAMRKELVNRHLEFFTTNGLDVNVVQMNPLAVYNALYYDQRLKGTTMLIDIGAENTDLIIAEEESVWLRSIPIGGNNFTEALTKSFKLRFDKAEDLKRNAATSKYARQILQAMRPVFADLVSEIQRSIGFYASVHRDSRIQRVMALGGTFRLPGLQKYLQQNLQLEVHRIDRVGAGAPDDARSAAVFNENLLSSVAAYGLALQAMGEGKITSSLLPMAIRRERMWRDKTKWFAAAAAAVVAGTLLVPGRLQYDEMQLEESDQQYASQIKQIETQAVGLDREWGEIEQQGGPDRMLITNIKSLEHGRGVWGNLLQDIEAAMPDPGPALQSGKKEEILKAEPDRAKRKVVQIQQIASRYEPDLTAILQDDAQFQEIARSLLTGTSGSRGGGIGPARPAPGGMMPFPMGPGARPPGGFPGMMGMGTPPPKRGSTDGEDTEAADKLRGYIVAVRCTTPYKDYSELSKRIEDALEARSAGPDGPQRAYYRIERVDVPSASKLQAPDARGGGGAAFGPRGRGGRGARAAPFPGGFPGVGGAAPRRPGGAAEEEQPVDTFVDPITGESLKNDWELTLLVAVVLDPKPVEPQADPEAEPGSDDAADTESAQTLAN